MNRFLKWFLVIIVVFFFIVVACKNSVEKTESNKKDSDIEIAVEPDNDTIIQKENIVYPVEETKFGTVCKTNITDENVNLRNLPSLNSDIIDQIRKDEIVTIIGFSKAIETIEGVDGYWVNVFYGDKKGWIFSNYINLENKESSKIKFVELIPAQNGRIPLVKLSYLLEGKEILAEIDYNTWKNYYVILWDCYQYGFHYTNVPGIYFLDKQSFELKHISYVATSEEWPHAWTLFTDDLEYILQDSGTSPGVRGITVWRSGDGKEVFSGSYYGIKIDGHIIEVVYPCDEWSLERGYTDEEIVSYGKRYKNETSIPEDIEKIKRETGLGIDLIIRCSYNLDTGERKIISGEYILVQ
jgi:uncharacterized protein YgiM (DUF1202 family)